MAQQKNDQPLQTGSKARDDHRKQRGSKITEYFWVVSLANISGIGWFKSYGKMLVAHGYIYMGPLEICPINRELGVGGGWSY